MAMTYADFTAYIARFCWRTGDTDFIADLSGMIRAGEARLNRDLKIERRGALAIATAESTRIPLPDDYSTMRYLSAPSIGLPNSAKMDQATPAEITRLRHYKPDEYHNKYAIQGRNLLLAGPISVSNPLTVEIDYYQKIPSLEDDGSSWVEDEFFDLYMYAVLRHTATYLREDERVGLWKTEYQEALQSVIDYNTDQAWASGEMDVGLPGVVW